MSIIVFRGTHKGPQRKEGKTMMMMVMVVALVAGLLGFGTAYFGLNYNFNFSDWWFDITYNYKHK